MQDIKTGSVEIFSERNICNDCTDRQTSNHDHDRDKPTKLCQQSSLSFQYYR